MPREVLLDGSVADEGISLLRYSESSRFRCRGAAQFDALTTLQSMCTISGCRSRQSHVQRLQ